MSEHTPTDEQMRLAHIGVQCGQPDCLVCPRVRDEYDRWLAQHDREVGAVALAGAAELLPGRFYHVEKGEVPFGTALGQPADDGYTGHFLQRHTVNMLRRWLIALAERLREAS